MSNWTPPNVVAVLDPAYPQDELIYAELGLTVVCEPADEQWVLKRVDGPLSLINPQGLMQRLDFTEGKSRHRTREPGHGAAPLRKALGVASFEKRRLRKPCVVDATGGWGQDAWLMASMGCDVILIEQHPLVHAVLSSSLDIAKLDDQCKETCERITLLNADACEMLSNLETDVIYLDPMYPHRVRKKADSKKGMQILQTLLPPANENLSGALLDAALSTAAQRVVVKRPKGADRLPASQPFTGQTIEIQSPNTRYDIYLRPTG